MGSQAIDVGNRQQMPNQYLARAGEYVTDLLRKAHRVRDHWPLEWTLQCNCD
jgi:hypothetical protein